MKDIMLDAGFDLAIANGDFYVNVSDQQHGKLLLNTSKNDWKQSPTTGVGIEEHLLDDDVDGLFRMIREQFTADGMQLAKVGFNDEGKIEVNAKYNS